MKRALTAAARRVARAVGRVVASPFVHLPHNLLLAAAVFRLNSTAVGHLYLFGLVGTCTDGVQNEIPEETGIDCGGPCPPCSKSNRSAQNEVIMRSNWELIR